MNTKKAGFLAATAMSIIIGFSFYFNKIALTSASPWEILAHRFTLAAAFSCILLIFKILPVRITGKDLLRFLPFTLFYPLCFFTLQILGLTRVQSSLASIIQSMTPLFTMVLATLILKEKTERRKIFFLLLSLSGILYISLQKGITVESSGVIGYGLLVLTGMSSAANFVLVRKYAKDLGFLKITVMAVFIGFIVFNLGLFVQFGPGQFLQSYGTALGNSSYLVAVLFLGIPSTLFTSMLTNFSLTRLEASTFSVFQHLGTLVSIFAGVMLLKEKLLPYEIIGSILILIGVLGTTLMKKRSS